MQAFMSAPAEAHTGDEWMIEEHLDPFGSVFQGLFFPLPFKLDMISNGNRFEKI